MDTFDCKGKNNNCNGVSIIVPAYNEEEEIGSTLQRFLQSLSCVSSCPQYEVIVVDDGSKDKTADIARLFDDVKVICRPHNMGYGAAIKTGVKSAKYEWILTLDGDGQHRPGDINLFFEAQNEGYDLIIGSRQQGSHKAWTRQPGKELMRIVANYLADEKIPDVNSGMRLFKKNIFFEFMPLYPNGFSLSTTMTLAFLDDGYSVKFVPITTYKRVGGKSNVHILRDGFNAIIMIMRAVSLFNPLRVFIPASVICGVFGSSMTLYNIIRYGRVPNTGVLMLLGALLIFLFGILADQFSLLRRQHSMQNNHTVREDANNVLAETHS
jgi:glycosyltransferase involved in cell wall biosynthesis